jgi:hypothetical protein
MLLNKGEFEGRRYLKAGLVKEMFTNQLPKELLPFSMNGIVFKSSVSGPFDRRAAHAAHYRPWWPMRMEKRSPSRVRPPATCFDKRVPIL